MMRLQSAIWQTLSSGGICLLTSVCRHVAHAKRPLEPRFLAWQGASTACNPTIDPNILEGGGLMGHGAQWHCPAGCRDGATSLQRLQRWRGRFEGADKGCDEGLWHGMTNHCDRSAESLSFCDKDDGPLAVGGSGSTLGSPSGHQCLSDPVWEWEVAQRVSADDELSELVLLWSSLQLNTSNSSEASVLLAVELPEAVSSL